MKPPDQNNATLVGAGEPIDDVPGDLNQAALDELRCQIAETQALLPAWREAALRMLAAGLTGNMDMLKKLMEDTTPAAP